MAVNIATSPPAATGIHPFAADRSGRQGAERLDRLVKSLEAVASELSSPAKSHPQRAALRARFNDLQRQVNELDGIVAPEGFEVRGQDRVARASAGPGTQRTARAPGEAAADAAPTPPPEGNTTPAAAAGDHPRVDLLA